MTLDLTPPAPMQHWHQTKDFSCGENVLDLWLKTKALKNEQGGASRTYVIADNARVVAYYALAVGSVSQALTSGNIRRNMPEPIPVMLLARLAVDTSLHGKGIGKALVRDAILRTIQASGIAGIRALLVNAMHEKAAAFYRACGFLPSPVDVLTLMLNLRNITDR
jgi:GNAT superfamily N-acetyltransferase